LNGVSGQIAPLFNVNTLASGGTNVFQIAASGAASFSNTVTANSGFVSSTGFTSGSNSLSSTNLTVGFSTYGSTAATVNGLIQAVGPIIITGTTGDGASSSWIAGTSTNSLQYNVQSGQSHNFSVNGVGVASINTSGFTTGSSTYGPTSASVNGNIVAQNALITEANGIGSYITGNTGAAGLLWNGTSGGGEATIVTAYNGGVTASFWRWNGSAYARSSVINSDGTYYNGSSYGPSSFTVAMGGSGQTSFTGVPNFGIRITPQSDGVGTVFYGTNAANTIINWYINDGGTFTAGASTYGPTSATVAGTISSPASPAFYATDTTNNSTVLKWNDQTGLSTANTSLFTNSSVTVSTISPTVLGIYQNSGIDCFAIDASGNVGINGTLHVGSSTYGPTSATVAGAVVPGYSGTVGTSAIYSGTGSPSFSAPNGSLYLRYDGGAGAHLYINTSGASSSGSTWSAVAD
jgi:hypothetical protein